MSYDEKRILDNYLDRVRTTQKRFDMYLSLKENEKQQISEYFQKNGDFYFKSY